MSTPALPGESTEQEGSKEGEGKEEKLEYQTTRSQSVQQTTDTEVKITSRTYVVGGPGISLAHHGIRLQVSVYHNKSTIY